MPTTQLRSYPHYTTGNNATLEADIDDFVGEFAADYDLDGLADAYRDAINTNLDRAGSTAQLCGNEFYCDYPAPDDIADAIRDAIQGVDLGTLAEKYDRTTVSGPNG